MLAKSTEKEKALKLRAKGLSYSEIAEKVSVSKSTLSLWLRSVPLTEVQRQRLLQKQLDAHEIAWRTIRERRISKTRLIKEQASSEIGALSARELWLIGIALYWAEGSKEHSLGQLVELANSDPEMIKLFLQWLRNILKIPNEMITFQIYLHVTSLHRKDEVLKFWSGVAGIPLQELQLYYKKHNPKTNRKNIGDNYFGVLRVRVRKSTDLNRRISGWVEGLYKNLYNTGN